jgi:biopolymer transport protein ExbB
MHNSITSSSHSRFMLGFGRLLLCAMLLGSGTAVFGQAAAPEGPPATGLHGQKTWIDKFKLGGWVMYPCVGFSVLTVWLSVDLWLRSGKKKLAPPAHINGVKDLFRMGDYVGAYQFAKGNPSAFSDVTRVSLSYLGDGQEATETAMYSELNKINASITTRINYLSVIGVCTPMVGLLGTVGGMMGAFETMGTSGISDPGKLSEKIGEVLMATATGLAIAIPAFMMFYVLRNRLLGGMHHVQETVIGLFRKMPYEDLKDCHVGEEEFYAARPNWVGDEGAPAAAVPA